MRDAESARADGDQLHNPAFVRALFDEMSASYGWVNLVSSLGFARRWRRQCVAMAAPSTGSRVIDLMSGMGELGPDLGRRLGADGQLTALDISPRMCDEAIRLNLKRLPCPIKVLNEDVLANSIPNESADHVYSSFGLKTFDQKQTYQLAGEVARILKPAGTFAFLEISAPPNNLLRLPYEFYIGKLIPLIGKLFMGNWDNYRLLGVYTRSFGDCSRVVPAFREAGLNVELRSYFFGCATGLVGRKP